MITTRHIREIGFQIGKTYRINSKYRHTKTEFTGECVANYDKFIVLKREDGIKESFLKIDLISNTNFKYKEIA